MSSISLNGTQVMLSSEQHRLAFETFWLPAEPEYFLALGGEEQVLDALVSHGMLLPCETPVPETSEEAIVALRNPSSSSVLFVFAPRADAFKAPKADTLLRSLDTKASIAVFRDISCRGFRHGVSRDLCTFPQLMGWKKGFMAALPGIQTKYVMGSSMGAPAAILCGYHLAVDKVVVWDLHLLVDPSTSSLNDGMQWDLGKLLSTPNGKTRYCLYYNCMRDSDRRTAEALAGYPGVELYPQACDGGPTAVTAEALAVTGALSSLFPSREMHEFAEAPKDHIDALLTHVRAVLPRDTQIEPSTPIDGLLDSFSVVSIVSFIQESYGVSFSFSEIAEAGVFDTVESMAEALAQRSSRTPKTAAMQHDPRRQAIERLIDAGEYRAAWHRLGSLANPRDSQLEQVHWRRLLDSIPLAELELTPLKLALVGTSNVGHLVDPLRFWMAVAGFELQLHVAEYNTLDQTILDKSSSLYTFEPDVVWLFTNYRDILAEPVGLAIEDSEVQQRVADRVARFVELWRALRATRTCLIVQNNADVPPVRIFGHLEGNVCWGPSNFLRQFNLELGRSTEPGTVVFDLDHIAALFGKRRWLDERYWYHSKHAFSLEAHSLVAFHAAKLIKGAKGQAKKCIILDLDDTLWGGVIGEDGLEGIRLGDGAEGEAYVAFQEYLLRLNERGIILAVCSKNEEETAKLPFLQHPNMRIRMSDVSVFIANWHNKADNIQSIASALGIDLSSLVFIDDNPIERELVRQMLPMVAVPELPPEPDGYVRAIDEKMYFETISFSEEDSRRAAMYQTEARRRIERRQHSDIGEFLRSLEMCAHVGQLDSFHIPRVAQLINKSNQFHLTAKRYSESDISAMSSDPGRVCRYFKLRDRFGDNGLISVFIGQRIGATLHVDTWVMSCRVLSRSMEEFVHNTIIDFAMLNGITQIIGRYIPTAKNDLVKDLYHRFGYTKIADHDGTTSWCLDIVDGMAKQVTYVSRAESLE